MINITLNDGTTLNDVYSFRIGTTETDMVVQVRILISNEDFEEIRNKVIVDNQFDTFTVEDTNAGTTDTFNGFIFGSLIYTRGQEMEQDPEYGYKKLILKQKGAE